MNFLPFHPAEVSGARQRRKVHHLLAEHTTRGGRTCSNGDYCVLHDCHRLPDGERLSLEPLHFRFGGHRSRSNGRTHPAPYQSNGPLGLDCCSAPLMSTPTGHPAGRDETAVRGARSTANACGSCRDEKTVLRRGGCERHRARGVASKTVYLPPSLPSHYNQKSVNM